MERLVRVRVEIDVTIAVENPVMRSAESQVADFILPALRNLKEATMDVKDYTVSMKELTVYADNTP